MHAVKKSQNIKIECTGIIFKGLSQSLERDFKVHISPQILAYIPAVQFLFSSVVPNSELPAESDYLHIKCMVRVRPQITVLVCKIYIVCNI